LNEFFISGNCKIFVVVYKYYFKADVCQFLYSFLNPYSMIFDLIADDFKFLYWFPYNMIFEKQSDSFKHFMKGKLLSLSSRIILTQI